MAVEFSVKPQAAGSLNMNLGTVQNHTCYSVHILKHIGHVCIYIGVDYVAVTFVALGRCLCDVCSNTPYRNHSRGPHDPSSPPGHDVLHADHHLLIDTIARGPHDPSSPLGHDVLHADHHLLVETIHEDHMTRVLPWVMTFSMQTITFLNIPLHEEHMTRVLPWVMTFSMQTITFL